jgi:type IV pilus assembly protein PilA
MTLASSGIRQGHKGFTLIELLVVIAIIGILSSVVLASLNTARNKGADAAIKSNLESVRPQAELYYDSNSSKYGVAAYAGDCGTGTGTGVFSDTTVKNALVQSKSNNGAVALSCGITAAGDAYSVATVLKTGTWWCIDSTGVARDKTSAGAAYTALSGTATSAHASANATVCQ